MLDAVVVGAGVAGLHQLHRLRELGLRVRAYDAADDVGGTWWWHGYPGARLDTEGPAYQYLFSEVLYRDWGWSERFPAGYEVLRWLRFVADRLDLRRDIRLGVRVVDARWDEAGGRWLVSTDRGETVGTRFLVACTGLLDAPAALPDGLDDFAGPVLRTAAWPARAPDLQGLRVGVLGGGTTGATGVQLVPALADRAHLTVFAGAPCDLLPRANPVYGWQEREHYRERFDRLRATAPDSWTGADEDDVVPAATAAGRRTTIEDLHRDGSRALWSATARGLLPAGEVTAYVRAAMRERLADRWLSGVLVPADGELGTARVPLDAGYLEVLARGDVEVVDAAAAPVVRVHPGGVERADGVRHDLDVVVVATDFDAGPPALHRIEVRGRDGRRLADEHARPGPAFPGFPHLFTAAAPVSPLQNATVSLEQQTGWIARAVSDLGADGRHVIEAVGGGVDLRDAGGVGDARRRGEAEAAAGYPSFRRWAPPM